LLWLAHKTSKRLNGVALREESIMSCSSEEEEPKEEAEEEEKEEGEE